MNAARQRRRQKWRHAEEECCEVGMETPLFIGAVAERSERRSREQVQYDLLLRSVLGLSMADSVWVPPALQREPDVPNSSTTVLRSHFEAGSPWYRGCQNCLSAYGSMLTGGSTMRSLSTRV